MESDTATSVTVLSSTHGRQRRAERNISKRNLKAAVRYGVKKPGLPSLSTGRKTWTYTFADIVYVTDDTSTHEITSYPVQSCGIDVKKATITPEMRIGHQNAVSALKNMKCWKSHTVAVVDQSGSMRKDDATEGATRSDVVWLCLTLDLIGNRLRSGEFCNKDVFSLITMQGTGKVLLKTKPIDWVLYNTLIDYLGNSMPLGDGCYMPSLDQAEKILCINPYDSCSLQLIFLSDGRPSDIVSKGPGNTFEKHELMIRQRVGNLASRFGRRLSIGAIAFGPSSSYNEFETLRAFANEAKKFGSQGSFHHASLSAEALSKTFTSLTLTLTSSKTELTDIGTLKQRTVRDVYRKSIDDVGKDEFITESWNYFELSKRGRNIVRTTLTKDGWKPFSRRYTFMTPDAVGVALEKRYFGEGAERIVREFREVGPDGSFVGVPKVAKESRFIEDHNSQDLKAF